VPIEEEKDEERRLDRRDEAVAGTTPNVLTNKKNASKPVAGPTVKASIGSTKYEYEKQVSIGSIHKKNVDWIDEPKNKKCRLDRYERRRRRLDRRTKEGCRRDDRN